MSNIHFSYPIMWKWLALLISTKDSFKITIRKRHVYIDINWPWICVHVNWYINGKWSFPNCLFVIMISIKCTLHIYFTFLRQFLLPHVRNNLIFFRLIGVAMSSIRLSALDNIKMTCQTRVLKLNSKFLLGKDMFTLTLIDLEYVYT